MAHQSGNVTWTDTLSTPIVATALENIENTVDTVGAAEALQWTPSDDDPPLFAWTIDPLRAGHNWQNLGGGFFLMSALKVGVAARTCTGCVIGIIQGNVAAGLTAGQSVIVLYDSTGAQVAITPDQSANWTTGGAKQIAWVTPFTVTPGIYWAGALSNGTTGPSIQAPPHGNGAPGTFGLTSSTWRAGFVTGVTTTIPSTRPTPTSSATLPFWVGLY